MKKKRIARKPEIDWDKPVSQADFGLIVNLPQQSVSQLVYYGILSPNGTAGEWYRLYMRFLQGQIFARQGWMGLAKAMGDLPSVD